MSESMGLPGKTVTDGSVTKTVSGGGRVVSRKRLSEGRFIQTSTRAVVREVSPKRIPWD